MRVFGIKNITLYTVLVLLWACHTEKRQPNAPKNDALAPKEKVAQLTFEKTTHDFGDIFAGERVGHAFRFTNTGNKPLWISGVRSGCGCMVGDYPREPVNPGESASVAVVFNSAGRQGFQSETIRILSNAQESVTTLRIKTQVHTSY